MTATHWIAIAAITIPLITSWMQFWLKERSEKAKLATATAATIQPKTQIEPSSPPLTFKSFFRQTWQVFVISWVFNLIYVRILLWAYFREGPVTHREVVIVAVASVIWLLSATVTATWPLIRSD